MALLFSQVTASANGAQVTFFKGFFACSLIGILPVELYKFSVSLQNSFSHSLVHIFTGSVSASFGDFVVETLTVVFDPMMLPSNTVTTLLILIAFCYCVINIFFANIQQGGIMLIQITVGELYMFSLPRGYADGFRQWCKQVAALCYGFLTIRVGDITVMDNIGFAFRYFLTTQQHYEWR